MFVELTDIRYYLYHNSCMVNILNMRFIEIVYLVCLDI